MAIPRLIHLATTRAERAASRRVVAAGLVAALSGLPALSGLDAEAKRRRKRKRRAGRGKPHQLIHCSGDSCDGTGGKLCGGRDDCQCYRAAEGGNVCASALQSSLEQTCTANHDCPRGHVCVEGGPACGGEGLRFCKRACYA